MKSAVCVVAAVAAQSALAGAPTTHQTSYTHYDNHASHVLATPRVAPTVIDRSNESKTCPEGFTASGKECQRVEKVPVEKVCPSGTTFTGDKCAIYVPKISECQFPYSINNVGECSRTEVANALYVCSDETTTLSGTSCTKLVARPPIPACQVGYVIKGDICSREVEFPAELSCAPDEVLIGKRCRRETTYDCTPERTITTAFLSDTPEYVEHGHEHGHSLRSLGSRPVYNRPVAWMTPTAPRNATTDLYVHKEKPTTHTPYVVKGKGRPDENEEYVVQKTCKRIHTKDADKVCPSESRLLGKVCVAEEYIEPIMKPNGFIQEFVPAKLVCPQDYSPSETASSNVSSCFKKDTIPIVTFCPPKSVDVGAQCAEYRPFLSICPPTYKRDIDECIKTSYAPMIVEYSVKFQCVGKECGDNIVPAVSTTYTQRPTYDHTYAHNHHQ